MCVCVCALVYYSLFSLIFLILILLEFVWLSLRAMDSGSGSIPDASNSLWALCLVGLGGEASRLGRREVGSLRRGWAAVVKSSCWDATRYGIKIVYN